MLRFFKNNGYRPVDGSPAASNSHSISSTDLEDDERVRFLPEKLSASPGSLNERRNWTSIFVTALNLVFFVVSCSLFFTWCYKTHWQLNAGLKGHHTYSPVLYRFDLNAKPTKVNGTLFPNRDGGSIARKLPNNASDEVWTEWELTRVIPVTADDIRRMGKDPSTAAKLEDEIWGLGDDAYAAIFDVYHQLHCLNTLRKIAYRDYYGPQHEHSHPGALGAPEGHADGGDEHSKEMFHVHINHCVDLLMQALQCSGNLNLITMHWVETQKFPFPDMSVSRQCVDFEGLTRWRANNTVDPEMYRTLMAKPDGVKQLKAPDQYYAHYLPGEPNPNHVGGANPGEDFNLR